MAFRELSLNSRTVSVHKASVSPNFRSRTVLVVDTWDYVSLWLRRAHQSEAQFYWEQARHFHDATVCLPRTSSPLTCYYCLLNAVKALLSVKRIGIVEAHGVSGCSSKGNKISLLSESITFERSGVLTGLCQFLGERCSGETYSVPLSTI